MRKQTETDVKCFICGRTVTEKDMLDNLVEMIEGPGFKNPETPYFNKKVFVCTSHDGIAEQVKEEA